MFLPSQSTLLLKYYPLVLLMQGVYVYSRIIHFWCMELSNNIDDAIEQVWACTDIASNELFEIFNRYKAANKKRITKRHRGRLALTEVMLLRLLSRHVEANKFTERNRDLLNGLRNPLFVHRWKRIQLIERYRNGVNTPPVSAIDELVNEAEQQGWADEHLRAVFFKHLAEKHSGLFKSSLQTAHQAKMLALQYNNPYYTLQSAWAVAHIYYYFGYKKEALHACLAVKHLFNADYNTSPNPGFYTLLADCYAENSQLSEAIEIFEDMLAFLNNTPQPNSTSLLTVSSNLANIYLQQGDVSRSEELYLRTAQLAESLNGPVNLLSAVMGLAVIYEQTNRHDLMGGAVAKAEKLARQLKITIHELEVLEIKARHQMVTGKAEMALVLYKEYNTRFKDWQRMDNEEKLKALEI